MPTPTVIQIDPKDLQPNINLGVGLPFNGPAVFNKVYSTKDLAKYKLINLLLTNKGEKLYNPDFGCDLKSRLFNPIIDNEFDYIKTSISDSVVQYIPEIQITSINIDSDKDNHILSISIAYQMKLSGDSDNIIIQFE